MQVEDPAPSGGAEERRLRRMEEYAASLSRASRSNERNDPLPASGGKATPLARSRLGGEMMP